MLYRKKPIVIEARQLRADAGWDEWVDIAKWCGGALFSQATPMAIGTLEGVMWANAGDWIIKGVQGEFYPCKPDIFDATYEPVE